MQINDLTSLNFKPIELSAFNHPRILVVPKYFQLGLSTSSKIYARQLVYDRLLSALKLLPHNLGFLVWDSYRPRIVQKKLFNWMKQQIIQRFPNLNAESIIEETKKYASLPSKVGEKYCPPHLSGGAIDLTLFNLENRQILNMGTDFDDCTELAHLNYYQQKATLDKTEQEIANNRRILSNVMTSVGFTTYHYEWWHYDLGDILWSKATKQPAIFGPLFGDLEWPKD